MLSFSCLLCLICSFCPEFVFAFNLENREPIQKSGEIGSYFGYSVAEHRISNNSIKADSWILVGAPLGQNLQPGTNRSGALFKCPITADPFDCSQVPTDGRRLEGGQYFYENSNSLSEPLPDEIKDNQWLGATVRSQGVGGKVLVCAHRYIHKVADSQWGQGLCYVLTNDLEYDEAYEPCKGYPTDFGHQQFGFCQAGTNGLLLADGTAVIGTPGPYTWRGTMFVIEVGGNFLTRDKTMYMTPLNDSPNPVDKYSYLGMSVAAGNFMNPNIVTYAAGAPRSNDTGQVIIFEKNSQHPVMNVVAILNGEQFASSFGYEITSADLNNDGLADLIVGAPFYFTKNTGGAVYVFINEDKDNKCFLKCKKPIKLTGQVESRFGFALANLGDLNKDSYDDLAIGAPYENNQGAVYIYLGAKNIKANTWKPAQILRPEPKIKTLGYSLSAGIDMDLNGYPDLLVGAFESDSVFLYKARPIIDIMTEIDNTYLKNIDITKAGCVSDSLSNYTCFSFKVCCVLKWLLKSTDYALPTQYLYYKIEAETFQLNKKFSRVFFQSKPNMFNQTHNIQNRIIPIRPDESKYCNEEIVYIKDTIKDILSPIKFQLNYTLGRNEINSPILNQQESSKTFSASFQKECGSDDFCETNLVVSSTLLLPKTEFDVYVLNLGEQDELKIDVNVSNFGESAYEAQLFIGHSNKLNYIAIDDKFSNITCNLWNETVVSCNLGNPFKSNRKLRVRLRYEYKLQNDVPNKESKDLIFKIFANSTSKEINPEANHVTLRAAVVKRAEVSINGAATLNVFYGGEVRGEAAMEYLDEIGSRVIHTYQVVNNGPWKVDVLNVEINWPFQVANNKPQGKWLLFLEEMPKIDYFGINEGACYLDENFVNPLGLKKRPGDHDEVVANLIMEKFYQPKEINMPLKRNRREVEMIVKSEYFVDNDGHRREIVNLNCKSKTAKCVRINCSILNLKRNHEATITIKSRIWNSTLIEDYAHVDWIKISSDATIHIPKELSILQDISDDSISIVTLAYPDVGQQEPKSVPTWIIIVAIIVGLFLLILLSMCLYKMGFFKRKRFEQTISGNLRKHNKEETPFLN